jgi:uncharacterized protein DUF4332
VVKHTVLDPQASSQTQPVASSSAPLVDTSDVIDWDLVIETPPRRRSGTIRASLIHAGRSQPLPVNEAGIPMESANRSISKGIVDIERIGEIHVQKLRNAGVDTVEQLLARGSTPTGREELSQATGIPSTLLLRWVNHAALMRIVGVEESYSELLEATGVDSVSELAHRNADQLHARMSEVNTRGQYVHRLPSVEDVVSWIENSKRQPHVVSQQSSVGGPAFQRFEMDL